MTTLKSHVTCVLLLILFSLLDLYDVYTRILQGALLAYLEESTTFTYKDPENTPQLWPFPGLSSISCLYSLCLIMVKKN